MTALTTFARALTEGGEVEWGCTPPRLRVAKKWASALRDQPEPARAELREVLRRAVVFRRQLEASAGGPLIPYLALPEAPVARLGVCISCGIAIDSHWRCGVCLLAVHIALGTVTVLVEIGITERGTDSLA